MTTIRPLRLLVVAGEVSGDQHAAALLSALRERVPDVAAVGLGGDALRGAGRPPARAPEGPRRRRPRRGALEDPARPTARSASFSRRRPRPEASSTGRVLVDSPDFNLPLARRLTAAGIPVVFYVSPQVWAWRSDRAKELGRLGRRILVLFAFEKAWYDARGLGGNVDMGRSSTRRRGGPGARGPRGPPGVRAPPARPDAGLPGRGDPPDPAAPPRRGPEALRGAARPRRRPRESRVRPRRTSPRVGRRGACAAGPSSRGPTSLFSRRRTSSSWRRGRRRWKGRWPGFRWSSSTASTRSPMLWDADS